MAVKARNFLDNRYREEQERIASHMGQFGDMFDDYLGIGRSKDGRARYKNNKIVIPKGLVCTSFVDLLLVKYNGIKLDKLEKANYRYGPNSNIFEQYRFTKKITEIEPRRVEYLKLERDKLHGVVFYMKKAWTKTRENDKTGEIKIIKKPPGSRIHVGFLAYHKNNLFLIHSYTKRRGVHIMAWNRFLKNSSEKNLELEKMGGGNLHGPKFLSIYTLGSLNPRKA